MEVLFIISYIISFLISFGVIILSWVNRDKNILNLGIVLLITSILVGFISGFVILGLIGILVIDYRYNK
jgi:hypothetical protein